MDPLEIGPDGAERAHELADENHRSMVRLRIGALSLVVGAGVVLIRGNAAIHALWVLPIIPLLFSADFKLGGLADAYGAAAAKQEPGHLAMASGDEGVDRHYRTEYYVLLALALLAVAVRG